MKITKLFYLTVGFSVLASTSCEDKDLYDPEFQTKQDAEFIKNAFDFNLSATVPIVLDYQHKKFVEVYDSKVEENPEAIQLFAGYTDANGHYEGTMYIPSAYIGKTVYARTLSTGLDKDGNMMYDYIPAVVKTDGVKFAAARSRVNVTGQDDSMVYLSDLYREYLLENTNNTNLISEGKNVNINILKDGTKLSASFFFSGGEAKIYYYYYKTGYAPQNHKLESWNPDYVNGIEKAYDGVPMDDITTKFMNPQYQLWADQPDNGEVWGGWCNSENEKYYCVGATSDLLFYGENYDQEGSVEWPAGYTVAFFLIYKFAFVPLYSDPALNYFQNPEDAAPMWGLTQVGLFKHEADGKLIYGWEDQPANLTEHKDYANLYGGRATDNDYNDAVYVINVTPGLDNVGFDDEVEEIPTEKAEVKTGTLLFEDLYPEEGDYDMNDVVIEYKLSRFLDEENKTSRAEYCFKPVHDGATYQSDFYFRLSFGEWQPFATTKVFENHKTQIGKECTGTILRSEMTNPDNWVWYEFDPFILVKDTNREVHLTKKWHAGIGSQEDLDDVAKSYVSRDHADYPFAMNIPGIWNFNVVTERVRIDQEYPKYMDWVKNNSTNADWYKYYNPVSSAE